MKYTNNLRLQFRHSLAILSLALSSVNCHAVPITFNSALPVSQNEWIVRGLVTIDQSSSADVDRRQLSLISVLGYGISSKWSAFGVLPIRDVSLSINTQSTTGQRKNDSAIGDTELFGRYEALRIDNLGSTYRVATFAGIRLPTGELGLSSDGTTDIFGGVIYTSANVNRNFNVQLRYDLNGNDNQFSAGDSFNADLSWQRRIAPQKITARTLGFWFAALETNLNYSARNRFADQLDGDSGGFTASVSPGIQYITRRWTAEMAVRIPLIHDLNGAALEPDYTIFTGIRANF